MLQTLRRPDLASDGSTEPSRERARLEWVVLDGRPRHVTDFAGLRRSERPACACPGCGEHVTLKLGEVLAPHAAHRGSRCGTTAGESALHHNAKFHLAAQLAVGGTELLFAEVCPSCETPLPPRSWPMGWDQVQVELRLGTRRPDIVLSRGGRAVGGVEVFATHAVDPEKAAALAAMGLPWLEVRAQTILRSGSDGTWMPPTPLPVHRSAPGGAMPCAPCAEAAAAKAEAQQRAARAAEAAARELALRRDAAAREASRAEAAALAGIRRQERAVHDGAVKIGRTLFLTLWRNRAEWTVAVQLKVIRVGGETGATVLSQGFVRARKPFNSPHWDEDTDVPMTPEDGVLGPPTREALGQLDRSLGRLLDRWRETGIGVGPNEPGDPRFGQSDMLFRHVLGLS